MELERKALALHTGHPCQALENSVLNGFSPSLWGKALECPEHFVLKPVLPSKLWSEKQEPWNEFSLGLEPSSATGVGNLEQETWSFLVLGLSVNVTQHPQHMAMVKMK